MSVANTTAALSQTLKHLLPTKGLPPVLKPRCGNLYEVLSRTPSGGIGLEVHQTRWAEKNIGNSYWVITRSQFKLQGKHGKAWGRLYWKGVPVSQKDERIPGSLKYTWSEGRSVAKSLSASSQMPGAASAKPMATP
ncbi:hypothetical protein BJ912DRAFT_870470 [Pholiota molesta]|nr:hypothetical protein BJ912DRAFT_870470 [Pholiota molesta]